MSKLEDGYFYRTSSGDYHFMSYDTLGGGGVFFILIILATIFIEKLGNFLLDHQWIVLIPTLIAVIVRFVIYEKESSTVQKICNVISDFVRTLGFYGVLIALFSKVLDCHILDRIFAAIGLGLLFAAAYAAIRLVCKFFRSRKWTIAHIITSVAVALICLVIYSSQLGNADIDFSPLVKWLRSPSSSILFVICAPLLGVLIGTKIVRETNAKLDIIGIELKKYLPCDAAAYEVNCSGISFLDKQGQHHYVSFEDLGYESFPRERETVAVHYINSMGKWLIKNIISNPQNYRKETADVKHLYFSLRSSEFIQQNILKKW